MTEPWSEMETTDPFDLAKTIECGQAFRWRKRRHSDVGTYYEAVIGNNVVHVSQVNGDIVFRSGPEDPKNLRPHLEEYLGLHHLDINQVYAELDSDSVMARLIDRHQGLRILRQDPWECLVSFILSPASSIDRTSQGIEAISRSFGDRIEFDGREYFTFPSPSTLVEADDRELEDLRLGFRANRVKSAAHTMLDWRAPEPRADRRINLASLADTPYESAFERLTGLQGVGSKVADCTLLFSLDHVQAFPVDTHVRQGIEHWYTDDPEVRSLPKTEMVKREKLREWGRNRFGKYGGYASQYIFYDNRWRTEENLP